MHLCTQLLLSGERKTIDKAQTTVATREYTAGGGDSEGPRRSKSLKCRAGIFAYSLDLVSLCTNVGLMVLGYTITPVKASAPNCAN